MSLCEWRIVFQVRLHCVRQVSALSWMKVEISDGLSLLVCVVLGCFSDRTQQLRQLYKTVQTAKKLQTSSSATAAS